MTHNDLKYLPKMTELRKLQYLYAAHNDIGEIPDFEGCRSVEQIYFGNNFIEEIPAEFCENMGNLKILELRDNKIKTLPDEIAMLQHVIRLDLTNNDLTSCVSWILKYFTFLTLRFRCRLPNSLGFLSRLQNLQLEGNKFKSIRQDVIKGGTVRLLKYLRDNLNEADAPPLKEVQIETPRQLFPDKYVMKNSKAVNLQLKQLTSVPEAVFLDAASANVNVVDLCTNKLSRVPDG